MAEEVDEFGIPIRKQSGEVDEFGIPIKKKVSTEPSVTGITGLSDGLLPNDLAKADDYDYTVPVPLTGEGRKRAIDYNQYVADEPAQPQPNILGGNFKTYVAPTLIGTKEYNGNKNADGFQQPEPEQSFGDSVENSVSNIGNRLKGVIPRLNVASTDIWQNVIGKEAAQGLFNLPRIVYDETGVHVENGQEIDDVRSAAYKNLADLAEQVKPTQGIVQNAKNFNIPGLAAGVVDAAGSLVSTAVPALATGGGGLITDMVGDQIASYNMEKARSKGISVDELYKTNQADFKVPLAIGTLSAGLELIGLKGATNLVTGKIKGEGLKRVAHFFMEANKEGLTEFVQTGLDTAANSLAQGKSDGDATKDAVNAMFSEKGLESYVMGVAGSGAAGGIGGMVRLATTGKAKSTVTQAAESIEAAQQDLANPNVSPTAKEAISDDIRQKAADISSAIIEDDRAIENAPKEIKANIDRLQQMVERIESVLNDESVSETSKEQAQKNIDTYQKLIDEEVKNIPATERNIDPEPDNQEISANEPIIQDKTETQNQAESSLREIWKKIGNGIGRGALEDGWADSFQYLPEALSVGGQNYQAHGMGKSSFGSALKDLFDLFDNGIDPNRGGGSLYTAPLVTEQGSNAGAGMGTASGSAYTDGAFMLIAKKGIDQIRNLSDIGGILVNNGITDIDSKVLDELRKRFPFLVIESYKNAKGLVEQLNNSEQSLNQNEIETQRITTLPLPEQTPEELTGKYAADLSQRTPEKVAKELLDELDNPSNMGDKERIIRDAKFATTEESYNQFGDRNTKNGNLAKTYFSKNGKTLDVIAQSLNNQYYDGQDVITTDDLVNYMQQFPEGGTKYSEKADALREEYKALTGKSINRQIAKRNLEKAAQATFAEDSTSDRVLPPEMTDLLPDEYFDQLDAEGKEIPQESILRALEESQTIDDFRNIVADSLNEDGSINYEILDRIIQEDGKAKQTFERLKAIDQETQRTQQGTNGGSGSVFTAEETKQTVDAADKALLDYTNNPTPENPYSEVFGNTVPTPEEIEIAQSVINDTRNQLTNEPAVETNAEQTQQVAESTGEIPAPGENSNSERVSEKPRPVLNISAEELSAPITNREKAADLAAKIRSLKSKKGHVYGGLQGIATAVQDGALETVASAIETGGSLLDAIQKGVDFIKKNSDAKNDAEITKGLSDLLVGEETSTAVTTQIYATKKRRRFTKQVQNGDFSDEFKSAITEDQIFYTELPNKVTVAEANSIIDYLGNEQASRAIRDNRTGMSMATRFTVGQILIKKFEADGDYEAAIEVLDKLTEAATDAGQGIQSLSLFTALSKEGQLRFAQREIRRQRDAKMKVAKPKIDKIKERAAKANKEAATEVADKFQKKINKVQEGKVSENPQPREYGASNRVVSKDRYLELKKKLRGKTFSFAGGVPVEVIEIAAYHVEATGRDFARFSKNMIADVSSKVKPHLRDLYIKAKQDLIEKGNYSEKDFFSDEELDNEIVSQKQAELKNKLTGSPESIQAAIKAAMKEMDYDLRDIIIRHYTVQDYAKTTLAEKLIQDAGLKPQEATELSKKIQDEFERIATKKKQDILDGIFSKKEKVLRPRETKNLETDLIRLTNLGAFTNEDIVNAYAERQGWPKLSEDNIKEIGRLADKIENTPDGPQKRRFVEDLLAYQANIKGVSAWELTTAVWYANVLSGHVTQLVNFVSNVANTSANLSVAVAQDRKSGLFAATGLYNGLLRGGLEAAETFRTGYSPIKGRAEIPPLFERYSFKGKYNPGNLLKYVRRLMIAADVIFFEGQKEMRAYQLAYKMASGEAKINPSMNLRNRALEIIGQTDNVLQEARNEAEVESQNYINSLQGENYTPAERDRLAKQSEKDIQRRIFEIVEEKRPSDVVDQAIDYAQRGTYNYKPEGALGVLAENINKITGKVPALRFIVPFTNIIANVANETINYTPAGFIRSARSNTGGNILSEAREPLSTQQKIDLTTKAYIGTAAMATFFALSAATDDDDEAYLEVTANGTGDYKKNYELEANGWQKYSFRVKNPVTGKYSPWISYQYTPLIVGLSVIGNIRDFEKYRNAKVSDTMMTKAMTAGGATARVFLDQTFLGSANNLLSSLLDPRSERGLEDVVKTGINIGKSFVLPNLYTQAAKEIESAFNIPVKNVGGDPVGTILRDIPVARDRYFDKINSLGDPIVPDNDKFISADKNDKLYKLLVDKKHLTIAPQSQKQITVYDMKAKKDRVYTDEEYYNYCKIRGGYIKEKLTKRYNELNKMDEDEFAKTMRKIKTKAGKMAKRVVADLPIDHSED